ncbi:hypothetical protein P797_36545 [Pseudomonas aeruginosa VRFPA04]|nr:hypothetical protein P797_36545 [Pseudomonas aeruginosa VRFPA04]
MIIRQDSRSPASAALRRRSSRSTLPRGSHSTITTRMLAMIAEAGLVPCADAGIRQMSRWLSPRLWW